MQHKNLIATSILAASCLAVAGCGTTSDSRRGTAQSSGRQQMDPNIASPQTSVGGTQSQRQQQTGVPFPEGSPYAGTTGNPSQRGEMRQGTAQSPDRQRINPDISSPGSSLGGTQSQRQQQTGVPFPEGSPYAGTTGNPSQQGEMRHGTAQSPDPQRINPDISSPGTSLGGTQSQRQRETGAPLPQGSSQAGTTAATGSDTHQWTAENVKQAQEALKSKGFYAGAADGVMGPDTQLAIRAFQSANGLNQTGTLDAQTAQSLGLRR